MWWNSFGYFCMLAGNSKGKMDARCSEKGAIGLQEQWTREAQQIFGRGACSRVVGKAKYRKMLCPSFAPCGRKIVKAKTHSAIGDRC